MSLLWRRLALVMGAILIVVCLGTVGFVTFAGYSVFDALYMSLITITTVGYFEVQPLSTTGRVFNSVFLMTGVSTMFFAIGVVTQTVIELEFNKYFTQRRTRRMIDKLKNHF